MSLIDQLFEFKRIADSGVAIERNADGTLRFLMPAEKIDFMIPEENVPYLLMRSHSAPDCLIYLRLFGRLITAEKVVP